MTFDDLVKKYNIDHPDLISDIKLIVSHIKNIQYNEVNNFTNLNKKEVKKAECFIKKHLKGVPVQKLLGYTIFYDLYIGYSNNTLTPRMETEILVEKIIEYIGKKNLKVLDLCTGSGCIGIAIKKNTSAEVVCADVSKKALKECKKNIKANNVIVEVKQTDMFKNICEKYDCIVCNPPYIPKAEYENLDINVKNYDPKLALIASEEGLHFYKIIANEAGKFLNKNGKIFLEIGYNQGEKVKDLLNDNFENIQIIKDYSGNDRIIIANKKESKRC